MPNNDQDLSEKSIQSLISELEGAYCILAWEDEPEERHALKKEIINRVRAEESLLPDILDLLDHHLEGSYPVADPDPRPPH